MLQLFAESCQDSFPACFNGYEKTVPGHLEVNWGLFLVSSFHPRALLPADSVLAFLIVHVLVCVCESDV